MFVLMDLGNDYIPVQKVSISKLLLKLAEQSQIFISVWNNEDSSDEETQDKSRQLAGRIVEVNKIVQKKLKSATETESQQIKLYRIASQSVEQSYKEVLEPMRFDYMSMKHQTTPNTYVHYYNNQIKNAPTPSQGKVIRLA